MVSYGTPIDQIEKVLDISRPTLKKYFQRELDTGAPEANAQVAKALFNAAVKDKSVAAMMHWLNSRANWKQSAQQHEHVHDFGNAPAADLELELLTIRSRKRIAAGTGVVETGMSQESDGVCD